LFGIQLSGFLTSRAEGFLSLIDISDLEDEDGFFCHDCIIINGEDEALDYKGRRAYLFNQAVRRMMDEIMVQEDVEIFKVLDSIAESGSLSITESGNKDI
jgi:hypothetical protein